MRSMLLACCSFFQFETGKLHKLFDISSNVMYCFLCFFMFFPLFTIWLTYNMVLSTCWSIHDVRMLCNFHMYHFYGILHKFDLFGFCGRVLRLNWAILNLTKFHRYVYQKKIKNIFYIIINNKLFYLYLNMYICRTCTTFWRCWFFVF